MDFCLRFSSFLKLNIYEITFFGFVVVVAVVVVDYVVQKFCN